MERKSTSGYMTTLYGNPISWVAKKQSVAAQLTTEAEFISLNSCAKELQWMLGLLIGLGICIPKPIVMNDNQGANFISREAQLNPNLQHIEIRYQYIRNLVAKSRLVVRHCPSNQMIANILTKPLGYVKVIQARQQLHMAASGSRRSVSVPAPQP